jgi:hypothetical protein
LPKINIKYYKKCIKTVVLCGLKCYNGFNKIYIFYFLMEVNPMCDIIKINCGKCEGKGILPEYRHIAGGTCFACKGRGIFTYTLKQYEKKQEKKRIEAEKRLIVQQQKQKEHAELLYTFVMEYKNHPEFIRCMADCPDVTNELYYEMHLNNTMRFMKSRGLLTQ